MQLIGPPLTKLAVVKAQEVGLNVTEDDLIHQSKVSDVMDLNYPLVHSNMKLTEVLKIFGDTTSYYFPVVDNDRHLLGIISVDDIRTAFAVSGLDDLVVAADIMEVRKSFTVNSDDLLSYAKELMDKDNLDYLPVVDKQGVLVGFLERQRLVKFISRRIVELHKQTELLEKAA